MTKRIMYVCNWYTSIIHVIRVKAKVEVGQGLNALIHSYGNTST